jgi:ketosteroid isomerase-like protein
MQRMRSHILRWVLVPALLWSAALWAQGGSSSADALAALARWRTAVLSGQRDALAAMYTTVPEAQVKTPQGTLLDPGEEPTFWSALAAKGMTSLNPKVLEVQEPKPGIVVLVLRIEMTLRSSAGEQPSVVSAAQAWVRQGNDWRIYVTQRSDLLPNPPRRLPEPAKPNTDLYPPPEEAPSEIAAALASAAKDHKRVILIFGGNWCYDCHVLNAAFHSKQIAPLVEANYHVVHVNIGEGDKNLDLAKKYEVPLNKGVPSLAVLDSSGRLLYSQKNGEFENSLRIGPQDVLGFLNRWKPVRN